MGQTISGSVEAPVAVVLAPRQALVAEILSAHTGHSAARSVGAPGIGQRHT